MYKSTYRERTIGAPLQIYTRRWKISRVFPIPKIDQPIDVKATDQFRCYLSVLKIYERVILTQLCSFISSISKKA